MSLVPYVCPRCGLTTEALPNSRVTHEACPNNWNRTTPMVPDSNQQGANKR